MTLSGCGKISVKPMKCQFKMTTFTYSLAWMKMKGLRIDPAL